MKISIDTDVDTFENAIAAVHAAYGRLIGSDGAPVGEGTDEEPGDDYLPGHWTPRRIRKLVEWLGESDAAVAVRYIAEHAPAVSMDEMFDFMAQHTGIQGFDGKAMGGRMSAVGFARNSIGAGVGPVYDTDYSARKYRMDKRLAAALLEEMDVASNG
ncbi:MAG TPA: hypothetical protein VGK17_10365 [Propionicimonas sp.]|jgi:hypothetical protein